MRAVSLAKQVAAVQEQRHVLYNSYKTPVTRGTNIESVGTEYYIEDHEAAESIRCLDAAIVTLRKTRKGA